MPVSKGKSRSTLLFFVSPCPGPKPDAPALVCMFPAIETAETFRWGGYSRHDIGAPLLRGRCTKKEMRAGDGTRVYRTRKAAVKAYRRRLAREINETKKALARLEALAMLDVESEEA